MDWNIREIREDVFIIEASSQYYLTSMFMRPQEFYESPFRNIQGKHFSVEEYMDTCARFNGEFSYFTDWSGFNIPSTSLRNFFKVFQYDLTMKERILFDLVREECDLTSTKPFYLIGTVRGEYEALRHELSHAYFFLYDSYRKGMRKLLDKLDDELYDSALYRLDDGYGYSNFVFEDEIVAYLATSKREDVIETFGWSKFTNIKVPNTFKKFFNKFDEDLIQKEV